jgi:hypothetical protein
LLWGRMAIRPLPSTIMAFRRKSCKLVLNHQRLVFSD